jgi:hypothetical protein
LVKVRTCEFKFRKSLAVHYRQLKNKKIRNKNKRRIDFYLQEGSERNEQREEKQRDWRKKMTRKKELRKKAIKVVWSVD